MSDDYSLPDENGREWWKGIWIDTGELSGAYHLATLVEIDAFMKHYNEMFGSNSHRIYFKQCSSPPHDSPESDWTVHPMEEVTYPP